MMRQKIRKERITKAEWYNAGGFANSALFRLQSRGGAWRYYRNLDRADVRTRLLEAEEAGDRDTVRELEEELVSEKLGGAVCG